MANRPVFVATLDHRFCIRENTEFEFYSGFSDKQQKKCIRSLHEAYFMKNTDKRVLEISSKSEDDLGIKLSAFNLMMKTKNGNEFSVECAFQASKVFEGGGPYEDLLNVPSRVAKKDERLRNSGRLIAFAFQGETFSAEPKTSFYNWLYINSLCSHHDLAERLLEYNAFTDIAFNPKRSINCQAEAAAIYVSLQKQGLLQEALRSKDAFLDIVYPDGGQEN